MKPLLLTLSLLLASMSTYATEPHSAHDTIAALDPQLLVNPHKPAEYPGGDNALIRFLSENIRYPQECVKQNIQGKVVVGFKILTDGTVDQIKVLRPVHPLLDAEAMRVVGLLKGWTPGERDGKPVNVHYALPIAFKFK